MTEKFLLDTSIVVRYFVDGDLYLEKLLKQGNKLLITTPVIIETIYVLNKIYKIEREIIYEKIMSLVVKPGIVLEDSENIVALNRYRAHSALSFIDCWLFTYAKNAEISLITYDKKLKKSK